MSSRAHPPAAVNEPILSYAPGSAERTALKDALATHAGQQIEIPLLIDGREVRTGDTATAVVPHDHGHVLATWHRAGPEEVDQAIAAALRARHDWSRWPWEERARVFLKAAELLAGPWRQTLNATTMLNQSKTAFQAEIDAACELIDFWRFNVHFAAELYAEQPRSSAGVWNWTDHRPLEGFVYAVSPFNFTAIGGNLSGAPALVGNTVVWKPSDSAVVSNYYVARLLEAAGLPPGVINFIPGDPVMITERVLAHPEFAGLHYTGSTTVFRSLWKQIGDNLDRYRAYPRIVGETGGKDFVVAHPSADPAALRVGLIRGAFEYQGQKCSAASRAYIPESVWARMGSDLVDETESLAMGDPADFRNFLGAVIHERAFDKIAGYIERARGAASVDVVAGGQTDKSRGWFVRPTILRTTDPGYEAMCEEIFGPVLTVHVYPDQDWERILELADRSTPYALTGAVFADDRAALQQAYDRLRDAAGNFYLNDKPTGAVVGQQPFGGGRASGTNDKAGGPANLLRWLSPRSVKETLVPPRDYRYPFMAEE
ncbi:MAG: L-glutamate gamma-semialdehyde dehydrogenase [Gemmatimonadota bacterium]|nr:L-glutamate gamma-semialdehyde dehydrogenase [Gemmatimonadota bacterium]